jgi:hypothetical protein
MLITDTAIGRCRLGSQGVVAVETWGRTGRWPGHLTQIGWAVLGFRPAARDLSG